MPDPDGPSLRRAVAVVLSRFPLITETFILREIEEMERQGQPVRLVPLLRESPATLHREAVPWVHAALYTPWVSPAILAANARALRSRPHTYVWVLARLLFGAASSPGFLARSLALFPKSVYLAERLREEGIGHVHAHFATHPALTAFVISSLAGIPFSVTVHAHDIFVRRAMLRQKLGAASFVRAISRFNRDFLAALYPALGGKLEEIHTGVDPETYASAAPPAPGLPALLCVAALKPYKGLPVLVEACRRLRDQGVAFRCELVGEGPQRAPLEQAIAAAGLEGHLRLLGVRPQHEVARLLSEATLLVLPSVVAADGQMEGIPVALMEAMAAGRPVVASSLSGIPELVQDRVSGLLVPPGDAAALATAIASLLADPEWARRMGQAGRRTVERDFRLSACVSQLLERMDRFRTPPEEPLATRLAASGWPGFHARFVGVRRAHERPESSVLELLVSDGRCSRAVVFKVQKPSPAQTRPPEESARRESEALARLHPLFAGGETGFGVPAPLHLDEARAGLVMEACPGVALDGLLRQTRLSRDPARREALRSAVRRAGRWLRLFQQHTPSSEPASSALETLVAAARDDLEGRAGLALGPALARRLQGRIQELAREARRGGQLVGHHGDFWPGNVYVADESVQVIDFEGIGDGLPLEDVAYFLVQLELFYSYPFLGAERHRLRAVFLEGYTGGEPPDPVLYPLCRLAKAVRLLGEPTPPAAPGRLRQWRRRRALRAILCAELPA